MDNFEGNSSDPGSLHKYLYTGNDPVNKWDPSGYEGINVRLIVSITLGILAAVGVAYYFANRPNDPSEIYDLGEGVIVQATWKRTLPFFRFEGFAKTRDKLAKRYVWVQCVRTSSVGGGYDHYKDKWFNDPKPGVRNHDAFPWYFKDGDQSGINNSNQDTKYRDYETYFFDDSSIVSSPNGYFEARLYLVDKSNYEKDGTYREIYEINWGYTVSNGIATPTEPTMFRSPLQGSSLCDCEFIK